MFGLQSREELIEGLVREIRGGSVRVFITLDANGYNTEIWSDKRGGPLENLVRYMIGEGLLVIDQRKPNRGPVGAVRYGMKLRG